MTRMKNNFITLEFEKTVSRLVGYDYGKNIYFNQAKKKIDLSKKNTIIFPNNIVKIGSSFVQGFFSEIIKKMGLREIKENIKIEAANNEIKEKIFNNLI